MLRKQHHIAIISSDWEKAREFYVNKLGFELVREVWRPAQNDYLRMLSLGETTLELSTYPGYMDSFVAACFLPHTDASLFPSCVQEF